MLKSLRRHIGIFGLRNAGKSSFLNILSKQEISIVSETPGTTTDPVKKFIEIPGIGPLVIIDTAGIDDEGILGEKRVRSTLHTVQSCDMAIIVCDERGITSSHLPLIDRFRKMNIPWFIVWNKIDQYRPSDAEIQNLKRQYQVPLVYHSFKVNTLDHITQIIHEIMSKQDELNPNLLEGLVNSQDLIVMVTPIDKEAPKKRLILPQAQALRDALDKNCMVVVLKESELKSFIENTSIKPKLVITDSQAFGLVNSIVPPSIKITSFSILYSRIKGPFAHMLEGTKSISSLKENDRILILESCSHHKNEDDIGVVKMPRWIEQFTNKNLHFDLKSGNDFHNDNISQYQLVIQCGGCMLTRTEVKAKLFPFIEKNIPVTNYGMCIAYTHGIFNRAIECFNENEKTKMF